MLVAIIMLVAIVDGIKSWQSRGRKDARNVLDRLMGLCI